MDSVNPMRGENRGIAFATLPKLFIEEEAGQQYSDVATAISAAIFAHSGFPLLIQQ